VGDAVGDAVAPVSPPAADAIEGTAGSVGSAADDAVNSLPRAGD
jgi:hypothetical protein